MRILKLAGLILGACLVLALPARAPGRFGGGRIAIVPSFGYWGWYSPFYYGPYWPYGYYPDTYSNMGEIKLKTNMKDAQVYINGAYAGTAGKLKSIYLNPKDYNLEIRVPGRAPYVKQVYVLPRKTITVEAYFQSGTP